MDEFPGVPAWLVEPGPLGPARQRHYRSLERFTKVKDLTDRFAAIVGGPGPLDSPPLAYDDPNTGKWVPFPVYRQPPLALVFEVSEMIYNLKVALDYATYALFEHALSKGVITFQGSDDLGKFEKSVQFPIRDTPDSFAAWAKKHRKWLAGKETLFESLQPYRRPMMRFLGDGYHNLDKHRGFQELSIEIDLTDARIHDSGEIKISTDHFVEWHGITIYGYETEGNTLPAGRAVCVYGGASVEVFLPDRNALVPTLEVLQSEIGALIDALDGAF